MEKAVKAGETTQFLSPDSKKVPKICPEQQGLTAAVRKHAGGLSTFFVIVI